MLCRISFLHIFPTICCSGKMSWSMRHLQQRDCVASILCTVDFWLMVCWDTHVLNMATKWATSTVLAVHNHYPLYFIFIEFCCAGINSVWEISCWYVYFTKHAQWDYPVTLKSSWCNVVGHSFWSTERDSSLCRAHYSYSNILTGHKLILADLLAGPYLDILNLLPM